MVPAAPDQAKNVNVPALFSGPQLSRRAMFVGSGALMVLGAFGAKLGVVGGWKTPVVSLHADEPYLDLTGAELAYQGRIATDWAATLDDEALIRLGYYL